MAVIADLLQRAREELFDKGLRNTLLNHKVTKARGAAVAGADPDAVYERLVVKKEPFRFVPKGMPVTESLLATPYEHGALQSRLLATYAAAREHVEERGFNILYLALGMLTWFEDENSQKPLQAPLLLVPVRLQRDSARDPFRLDYDDEEVETNLPLAARLAEMRIEWPALQGEDVTPSAYFEAVVRAIESQPRWQVDADEVVLGFFSFAKLLMVRDLESRNWCTPENPDGSPLVAALLRDGFQTEAALVPEDHYLDRDISPERLSQVMDADSSQALAMLDVQAGRNLVIQGPPGTGKSQTITNMIADAIGAGKRVLFVAEKSAALDVVKRRLDKVGIGDACLALHSHAANKKALLRDLEETLRLGAVQDNTSWSIQQYKTVRDQLNAYCLALNTPVEGADWTPQQLMGELCALRDRQAGCVFPVAAAPDNSPPHTKSDFRQKRALVGRLADLLGRLGKISDHPLTVSHLKAVLPSEREQIEAALAAAVADDQAALQAVQTLGTTLGIPHRADRSDAALLTRAAQRAMAAPHLLAVSVRAAEWSARREDVTGLLQSGARHAAVRDAFNAALVEAAWTSLVWPLRTVFNDTGRHWWRWFSGDYRRARKALAGLCKGPCPGDADAQLALVDAILEAQKERTAVEALAPLGQKLFGVQWQGLASDWAVLQRISEWMIELHRDVAAGQCPQGLVDFLDGSPMLDALKPMVDELARALAALDVSLERCVRLLHMDAEAGGRLAALDLQSIGATLQAMTVRLGDLPLVVTFNNLTEALAEEGLGWVLNACKDWSDASVHAPDLFARGSLESMLKQAYASRPALRVADGAALTSARESFQELDVASQRATQIELARKHHAGLPIASGMGNIGVLMREFQKRSRHLPIRRLMEQAGSAVQALKPVFMMSPMSVAAFIPPGSVTFDLVIFDEASQVRPVDSLGAVLRGKQLVVVGDTRQLPPTSFFDTMTDSEDQEDEDTLVTADMESVLGLVCSRGAKERMLRWHYRSRHHSLIALANKEFYDNRLIVFPSPEPSSADLGLVLHHLPDTVYERGGSRSNPLEAAHVAAAVMAHARKSPHLTLGVAAFSLAQSDAILAQVEALRREQPEVEAFFAAHPFEPFFVKNLESVQGDERDVIFISVGYGRSEGGYLAMNFGALNKQGGERRLNVLITRARRQCAVFTNLTHDDIDIARSSARGVVSLKAFLQYAATGRMDVPDLGTGEIDSPFEDEVARALRSAGHEIVHQVGSGGFRIDLAVRDPEKPGRYLLGLECDGATYHSSRSARDRDRLRQQVLEGLGWTIHRIWSTDWFADPDGQLREALAAIERATLRASLEAEKPAEVAPVQPTSLPVTRAPAEVATEVTLSGIPYAVARFPISLAGAELHQVAIGQMAEHVARVVDVESPVHFDDLARRITLNAGLTRVGSRIESRLRDAVIESVRRGAIRKNGEFLWTAAVSDAKVRDRSALEVNARSLTRIAPEELAKAIHQVVDASLGISVDELAIGVSRLFGLQRTTTETAQLIADRANAMVEAGQLKCQAGVYRLGGD